PSLPPISTLFPYTTLFRSWFEARLNLADVQRHLGNAGAAEFQLATLRKDIAGIRNSTDRTKEFALDIKLAESLPQSEMKRRLEIDRKSTRLNSSHLVISYA